MNLQFVRFALLGFLAFYSLSNEAIAVTSIKVMSFNIRFGSEVASNSENAWISTSENHRRDLVCSVINDYGPDILGVQEALLHQVNDLKKAMPNHVFFGAGRDDGLDAGEHCGIYFRRDRFKQTNQGTFWLSTTPDVPSTFPGAAYMRIATWVVLQDIQSDDHEYFVLNTHWDHICQPARKHSASLIRERISLYAGDRPVIVMGDMNVVSTNEALVELLGLNRQQDFQLLDSYRNNLTVKDLKEGTFNNFTTNKTGPRIDYILHCKSFDTVDASIIHADYHGRFPSDHFPVTSILMPTLKKANSDHVN